MRKYYRIVLSSFLLVLLYSKYVFASNNSPSYLKYNNHIYELIDDQKCNSYDEALAYCKSIGGHMATLTSRNEDEAVYQYIRSLDCKKAFFGLKDTKGDNKSWEWCTEESFSYMNWDANQPNRIEQRYGMYHEEYLSGQWNDDYWTSYIPFICEWETESAYYNSLIITDYSEIPKYWDGEGDGNHGYLVVRRGYQIYIDNISDNGVIAGRFIFSPSVKENSFYGAHGQFSIEGRINPRNGNIKIFGKNWIVYPDKFSNWELANYVGYIDIKNGTIKGKTKNGVWLMSSIVSEANKIPLGYMEFKNSLQYDYTGENIEPEIVVVAINGKGLRKGTDYSVTFKNNTEPGIATVTVIGKGDYCGNLTAEFKITGDKLSLKSATIKMVSSVKYNGKPQTPAVTIKLGAETLKKDTDYSVFYSNNVYVGTATVIVTGKGKYTGTVNKIFSITSPGKVTVKLNPNGGKVSKKSVSLSRGTGYGNLPRPTWKGNVFAGWYTAKKGGILIDSSSHVTKPVTLYAHWSRAKYAITYNLNGGENSKKNPVSYVYNSAKITLASPTRTGYTFGGWYFDSKFKKKVTAIAKGSTGDKILYAKWIPITYTVIFDGNGATSGMMSSIKASYDKIINLPTNKYVRKGYIFSGWSISKRDSVKYNNSEEVKNLTTQSGQKVTLYAVWKKTETSSDFKKIFVNYIDDKVTYTYDGYYTDDYFKKSALMNQKGLAMLSVLAAASTYQNGTNYSSMMLKSCGFIPDGGFLFSQTGKTGGKSTKGENDHARVQFGVKPIEENGRTTLVVAVFINGYTSGGYEWLSNFNLGNDNDHNGFYDAESEIRKLLDDRINDYIRLYGTSVQIKFWITGHSRAAAITNILATNLTKSYGMENVYAYGFATPRYSKQKTVYGNIRNYIIPGDFVPKVAPAIWGYTRNGEDIQLSMSEEAKTIYTSMTGLMYGGFGTEGSDSLLKAFLDFAHDQENFNKKQAYYTGVAGLDGIFEGSPQDFCQNGMGMALTDSMENGVLVLTKYSMADANAALVYGKLIVDGVISPKFKDAHRMASYISAMAAKYGY